MKTILMVCEIRNDKVQESVLNHEVFEIKQKNQEKTHDVNQRKNYKLQKISPNESQTKKIFKCDECGKCFSNARNFQLHRKTVHEGRKDKKCEECGERFGQNSSLTRHKKFIHDGRKDYKCQECGKEYGSISYLTDHMKVVHEKIKYKCEDCGKEYNSNQSLTYHMKVVHEKIKDHKCD